MKRIFLLLTILIATLGKTQNFDILSYHTDFKVKTDGSVEVHEKIKVIFKSKSRGIIRAIPVRYTNRHSDGEVAQNRQTGSTYSIYLKDIKVEREEFSVYERSGNKEIKIGSVDKYIEGEHTYDIHYTVWGAINRFKQHDEFIWNPVGHDWQCGIAEASFKISLEKNIPLSKEDVVVFTGSYKEKKSDAEIVCSKSTIEAKTTVPLKSGEGMTLGLFLPHTYFKTLEIPFEVIAEKYYYNQLIQNIGFYREAYVQLSETIDLKILKPDSTWKYPLFRYGASAGIKTILFDISLSNKEFIYDSLAKCVRFKDKAIKPGNYTFNLSYKLWGAFDVWRSKDTSDIALNIFSDSLSVPVKNVLLSISFDSSMQFLKKPVLKQNWEDVEKSAISENSFNLRYDLKNITEPAALRVVAQIAPSSINKAKIPYQVIVSDYLIPELLVRITFNKDGSVNFNYKATVWSEVANNTWSGLFSTVLRKEANRYFPFEVPHYSFLNPYTKYLIEDLKYVGNYTEDDYLSDVVYINWFKPDDKQNLFNIELSYRIFDLLKKEGGNYKFYYPIHLEQLKNILKTKIVVEFQDEIKPSVNPVIHFANLSFDYVEVLYGTGLEKTKENLYEYEAGGEEVAKAIVLECSIPEESISKSFSLILKTIWINNIWAIICLLLIAVVFIFWIKLGKDKKHIVVVQYQPPTGLTPAEAGYLWDNKLHKHDLVSLIIWWASKGIIRIKELDNDEYEFTKIKELPVSAKDFEHTIFDALFNKGDKIKTSEMSGNFYSYILKAHSQLTKNESYFYAGSRKFSLIFKIAGLVGLLGSLIWMFGAFVDNGVLQIPVFLSAFFGSLILFGFMMPRKAPFGEEKYAELKGYYEFIKNAEQDKLEWLSKAYPNALHESIAFAIVMGLGGIWMKKIESFMPEDIEWISFKKEGTSRMQELLIERILRSMRKFERDLTYNSASSGSRSGGGYRSGGSSFGSSSSGGSSSSFRSGGGYSGGGYGGGGGRSW